MIVIIFRCVPKIMDLHIVNLNSFQNIVNRKSKKEISRNKKCWLVHVKKINEINFGYQTNKISHKTRWHYNNCLWELKYQLNKKQIVEKWKKKLYAKIMNFISILRKGKNNHLLSNDNLLHIIEYLIH